VTGQFYDTAIFGSHTLTSSGDSDIFVAKIDPNGNWLWAVKAGGTDIDTGYGIAVDEAGNAWVTGSFQGIASFSSHTLTTSGSSDIFAAKLDSSGNWLRAVKAGGAYFEEGYRIALDGSGNTYVTGMFQGTVSFGSRILTASGASEIFVAKLSPTGNWLWAVKAGGTGNDVGADIALDGAGNVWVTGHFQGTASFGSHTLTSSGNIDIFVARLSPSGNWLWAVKAGGTSYDSGKSIAVDAADEAWATGVFTGTVTFGNQTLTAIGDKDIFVARLDSSGNWLWAVKAGGTGSEWGSAIALDGMGNAYGTGYFESTAYFGDHTLTTNGMRDIFVAKLGTPTGGGTPKAPQNLVITTNGADVLLNWDDVTEDINDNPLSVDYYLVYYCATCPEGPFTVFGEDGSITQSQWTHSGATSQSPGFYYVKAVVAD